MLRARPCSPPSLWTSAPGVRVQLASSLDVCSVFSISVILCIKIKVADSSNSLCYLCLLYKSSQCNITWTKHCFLHRILYDVLADWSCSCEGSPKPSTLSYLQMMCDANRVNALTMRMSRLGASLSGSVICITSSSGMPLNLSIFRFFFTTDMWSVIISCFSTGFSSVVLLGSQCNQQINKQIK